MEVLGWLVLIIPLLWVTVACYFFTVPTFGEALFSENGHLFNKAIGVLSWCVVILCWYSWLSVIEINM